MWQKTLREDTDTINYRFQRFNENALEFLRTLRIVKPDEIKPVSSLNGVISCLNFLRKSQSLASGVRVDLVREFIAIVNQVRLKFEEIQEKEASVSFDIKLSSEGCELFHDYLEKLEDMLEPSYIFESNEKLLTHSLSVLEKELFTGLLSYIPSLLSVLFALNESLTCLRTEKEIDKILNYDENATKEEEDNENDSGQGEEMKSE